MSLNDKLKIATIEDLKQIDIIMINYYAKIHQDTLNFLYNKKIIDNTSIENALEIAVFNQARKDYNIMTKKRKNYPIFADHIGSPECFAYALKKNKFSKREIIKIPFDHGDTIKTYIQRHSKENLLSIIREKLLNI